MRARCTWVKCVALRCPPTISCGVGGGGNRRTSRDEFHQLRTPVSCVFVMGGCGSSFGAQGGEQPRLLRRVVPGRRTRRSPTRARGGVFHVGRRLSGRGRDTPIFCDEVCRWWCFFRLVLFLACFLDCFRNLENSMLLLHSSASRTPPPTAPPQAAMWMRVTAVAIIHRDLRKFAVFMCRYLVFVHS